MKEINELQELIIEWAKEKNLNDPDKQYLKILEEIGETARAILKNDVPEIKDGIGDIAVTVIIFYWQNNIRLDTDLSHKNKDTDSAHFDSLFYLLSRKNIFILYNIEDLAQNHDTTLKECLNLAWNEIKDRQGKTVNGTFIKK